MPNQGLARRRVLVVEDDYFIAADLTEMLEHAGAEVIGPAGNVRDGIAALSQSPEVATLDVRLGDETSFPIADELARRGVPFIFSTGTGGEIPVAHQARPICSKPLDEHRLVKALAEALQSK